MGATRTRISLLPVAAACAVAALVGCSGGDGPVEVSPTADAGSPTATVSPSASPSVTVSPSPSSTALSEEEVVAQLPAATRTQDLPGAIAFAAFFVELSQEIYRSPDLPLFEALSKAECEFCEGIVEEVDSVNASSMVVTGGDITVETATAQGGLQDDGTWYIEFPIEVDSQVFTEPDGTEFATADAHSTIAVVILEEVGTAWRVVEVGSKDPEV